MTAPRVIEESKVPPGSVVYDLDGTTWRVLEGRAEEVLPPGHPRPGCAHCTAVANRRHA
jgi:hypothetical protein